MKKFFTLIIVLNAVQGFSQSFLYRHDTSTWYSLLGYAVVFIGIITYLFARYRFEQFEKKKNPEPDGQQGFTDELDEKTSTKKSGSAELLELFMLKRKGIISENEYHQLKTRALKRNPNPFGGFSKAKLAY